MRSLRLSNKNKKSIFKKWWFWLIVVIVIIIIGSSSGNDSSDNNPTSNTSSIGISSEVKTYEKVDLRTMVDDLSENAMKAENKYQDKYVEIKGRITNFDSDGSYISIEPVNADAWDFTSITCRVKNETHKQVLMNKSVDDTVTIKGKITSIGEFLGYDINIEEIK